METHANLLTRGTRSGARRIVGYRKISLRDLFHFASGKNKTTRSKMCPYLNLNHVLKEIFSVFKQIYLFNFNFFTQHNKEHVTRERSIKRLRGEIRGQIVNPPAASLRRSTLNNALAGNSTKTIRRTFVGHIISFFHGDDVDGVVIVTAA